MSTDELFAHFVANVIQGAFTTYCEYSIKRPELIQLAKEGLIGKIDNFRRKSLLHSILSNVTSETEKVLADILQGYPIGSILKLALLFHDKKNELRDQIRNITPRKICTNIPKSLDMETLLNSTARGEIQLKDFFRIIARLIQERKIDWATYKLATSQILHVTGHLPMTSLEKQSCTSLTIANTSAYFVHSMSSTFEKRISILYRVHESCQLLSAFWRNESLLIVDMKEYHAIQPVASLNNFFWTIDCQQNESQAINHLSEQGCKLISMTNPFDSYLIVIHPRQKTRTSILEIDRVLQVDASKISVNPPSIQLSIVVEGHFTGREESDKDATFDGDDATTELGQSDTQNNSPNASGQDESHNIIPDFSWKSGTYLLNMICTEHYSLLLSVVNLSEALIADQRVAGVKIRRNCVFLYGLHGLCAVHQLNKCCPHSHQTTLLVPDTTLANRRNPQLNEHRFHSHSCIVTALDASEDGLVCVSGDNQGKICVWSAHGQPSMKSNHAKAIREFDFPSFHLTNWYNDHNYQRNDLHVYDAGVRSLKLSPSQNVIVAAIGKQLLLLQRQTQTSSCNQRAPTGSCLYVSAILDIQEQCVASYEVVIDHQCMLTIWRLTSSIQTDKEETQNFSTLTVWKHVDPSLNLLFATDNISTLSLQEQIKDEKEEPLPPNRISGFVEIGSELIPLTDVVHISIHPCTQLLVARYNYLQDHASSSDGNINVTPREYAYVHILTALFAHKQHIWTQLMELFAVLAAAFQPATIALLSTALDISREDILNIIDNHISPLLSIEETSDHKEIIAVAVEYTGILKWMTSIHPYRITGQQPHSFWIDISLGHNLLCAMYLRYCGNKSIAIEHPWQTYLQTYGPYHLRRSSRGLRPLTTLIRKIDETANIKQFLPHQIGYISGLQEIYARRVGLSGTIPKEIGELHELRVLSMGNNRLTGPLPASLGQLTNLQRIVLHQNNLIGEVPQVLGEMGCIVNLAGNPRLEYGEDVTLSEREALIELFYVTKGHRWTNRTNWISIIPVCKWYKVGVLSSHVHSLVMSSNNMDGILPPGINRLCHLRMIELATMPHLIGSIPKELCQITTLRRLCICRCGLTGPLPDEIGMLVHLEELQLFGNRLTGRIPASIGNLINLKLLSLGEYTGGNDFQLGYFPACIEHLVNLEALFLADCKLKGPLPSWIGNLKELRQLDLQRNQLNGPLPASIGRLSNLLYLNIKDNPHLGGRLPVQELANLARLNRLSLVHCGFEDRETAMNTLRLALPRCKIWI